MTTARHDDLSMAPLNFLMGDVDAQLSAFLSTGSLEPPHAAAACSQAKGSCVVYSAAAVVAGSLGHPLPFAAAGAGRQPMYGICYEDGSSSGIDDPPPTLHSSRSLVASSKVASYGSWQHPASTSSVKTPARRSVRG
jgi:hypothetical protein